MASSAEVAEWMRAELERSSGGFLYQEVAVYEIRRRFGEEHTYDNENGNLAISKTVLTAFRKLTADTVVWERSDKCWRRRKPSDGSGRQVD